MIFKHHEEKEDFFFLFAKIREQISSSKRSETLQHNGVHCQRKYLCYIELLISTDKNQFLVTFSVTFSKWSHWNHSQHFNSTSDNFFFLFPTVVWIKSSTVYENPPKMSHLICSEKWDFFSIFHTLWKLLKQNWISKYEWTTKGWFWGLSYGW
mgnify:CR=1 FL=1